MQRYVIRRLHLAHCKRGPEVCEKCREMNQEKICLLDVCPSNAGMVQRRVIELVHNGKSIWREFDIVRTFESAEEAQLYADSNSIEDVEI